MDGDWGLVTSNTITPPMRSRPRKAKVRSPKVTEVTASGSGPLLSERFRNEAPALWLELKKSAQGIFRSAPAKQVSLARYCSTISPESHTRSPSADQMAIERPPNAYTASYIKRSPAGSSTDRKSVV